MYFFSVVSGQYSYTIHRADVMLTIVCKIQPIQTNVHKNKTLAET